MKIQSIIAVVVSVSALLSGCATSTEKLEVKKQGVKAINRIPTAIYDAAELSETHDLAALRKGRGTSEEEMASGLAKIDSIQQRVLAQEKAMLELVNTALDVAGTVVPGGGVAASAIKSLLAKSKTASDIATAAQTEAKAAGIKAAEAVEKANDAKLAVINKDIQGLHAIFDKKESENQATLQKEIATLDKDRQAKFKENFLALLAQNGASKVELEKATTKTPGELAAMVTGGSGLSIAVLLALLRTFQPSRAKDDVDQLKQDLARMQGGAKSRPPS